MLKSEWKLHPIAEIFHLCYTEKNTIASKSSLNQIKGQYQFDISEIEMISFQLCKGIQLSKIIPESRFTVKFNAPSLREIVKQGKSSNCVLFLLFSSIAWLIEAEKKNDITDFGLILDILDSVSSQIPIIYQITNYFFISVFKLNADINFQTVEQQIVKFCEKNKNFPNFIKNTIMKWLQISYSFSTQTAFVHNVLMFVAQFYQQNQKLFTEDELNSIYLILNSEFTKLDKNALIFKIEGLSDFNKSKWVLNPRDFKKDKTKKPISESDDSIEYFIQKSTGRKCVIKRTHDILTDDNMRRRFYTNLYILANNKHPAIVSFIGFYEKQKFGYIVEEEIEKGSLQSALNKNQNDVKNPLLDETHKLIISYGISCAMEFLHDKQIIHRDLKCSHILLDSELRPYLFDFSRSAQIEPSIKHENSIYNKTATINAPDFIEDLDNYSYTLSVDVYAYGITVYELFTGIKLFSHLKGAYHIFGAVTCEQKPSIPDSIPKNWHNLINRCYSHEPKVRPTFTEICDLLESDEFVNNRIDRKLFENYKKLVKPFRPIQQIKELTNQILEIQSELDESKKIITKLKATTFNPFEEQEKKVDEEENYFIGNEDQQFYKTVKKIGEGATSVTYKVIDTRTNQNICKKVLKMTDEGSSFKNAQNAIKEFEVLRMIQYPSICKAYKINIQEPLDNLNHDGDDGDSEVTTISLYLEFLPRSLKESIDKKMLDSTLKARIAIEVAHALNFIHKQGMIHRDVKIENIMLNSVFEAKVVDFGLVRIDECYSGQNFVTTSMTKGVGTLSYMSPEMLSEEEYDSSTDVYSYGIVLYYLLIGKLPEYNMKDKLHGKPIPLPEPSSSISKYGIKLISKCTNYDASKRPSFEEILKEMREQSYEIAPEIDIYLISKRDRELSFFEAIHNQNK